MTINKSTIRHSIDVYYLFSVSLAMPYLFCFNKLTKQIKAYLKVEINSNSHHLSVRLCLAKYILRYCYTPYKVVAELVCTFVITVTVKIL